LQVGDGGGLGDVGAEGEADEIGAVDTASSRPMVSSASLQDAER
jgi:hypothetical protein